MAKHDAPPSSSRRSRARATPAHHGGAWKVAYADFVTAMMAFFLLLWLLNVTTDVQKRGIADYFEPTISSKSESGAGGVLGGLTIGSPGAQAVPTSSPDVSSPPRWRCASPTTATTATTAAAPRPTPDKDDQAAQAERQADRRQGARSANSPRARKSASRRPRRLLKDAIKDVPELAKLAKNLLIDDTPEGLRIQLVDQDKQPMFPLGSAEMLDPAKKLMALVAQVVQQPAEQDRDQRPYRFDALFDRAANTPTGSCRPTAPMPAGANSSPTACRPSRITRIVGLADREPLRPRRSRLAAQPPHQHRAAARGEERRRRPGSARSSATGGLGTWRVPSGAAARASP